MIFICIYLHVEVTTQHTPIILQQHYNTTQIAMYIRQYYHPTNPIPIHTQYPPSITNNSNKQSIQLCPIIYMFIIYCISLLLLLPPCAAISVSIQDSHGNIVPIYDNNTLQSQFYYDRDLFCCFNHYIFTYNQTSQQYIDNAPYYLYINNIPQPSQQSQHNVSLNVSLSTFNVFNTRLSPTIEPTACVPPSCTIAIRNNCHREQAYDGYILQIPNLPTITYNIYCNTDITVAPFQWGLIILVFISTMQIIVCSYFQQANSFGNKGHYITWKSITIYCAISVVGQILILVPFPCRICALQVLQYATLILSFIFSTIGIWVCTCQFLYITKCALFRKSFNIKSISIRIMDVIGLLLGIAIFMCWIFVDINWIVSDLIYFAMYVSIIKFIKFDSLRIAFFMFVSVAVIDLFFILFLQFHQNLYFNNIIMTYFNNPFFIMCPIINYIPNQQCSWFFIGSIAYPGILLSYLRRFDQNSGSRIYTTIFIITFMISSVIWIGIGFVTPFIVPYDMIDSPICLAVVVIFAKKRAELYQLWSGKIYDAKHKNRKQAEKQIENMIRSEKMESYNTQWFKLNLSNSSSQTQTFKRNLRHQHLISLTKYLERNQPKDCRSSV